MTSTAQFDANRRNAAFSTGPRTPEGKARSSRNAIQHNLSGTTFVILPGENVAAFDALLRDYRQEWNPKTPHESFLVTQMVQARWRTDRIARMEAAYYDDVLNVPKADGKTDEAAVVEMFPLRGQMLDKLHRYAQDAQRAYYRASRELQQYRKAQREQINAAKSDRKTPALAIAAAAGAPANASFATVRAEKRSEPISPSYAAAPQVQIGSAAAPEQAKTAQTAAEGRS